LYVDAGIPSQLGDVAAAASEAEAEGYDALWATETSHDPFLPLTLAAQATEHVQLGTSIAVAFARSPMTLAMTAWDLQGWSQGRFLLGLGSQIKPHIERRFSMPWSHPAPRMKEFISAMRAIWDAWQDGTKLDFRGDFYTHTLMTPFFDPGPLAVGAPKVFLAAVGTGMTEVAAEVADGLLVHPFTTERYLREVTVPTVEAALEARGAERRDFQLAGPLFVVAGATEEERANLDRLARRQISFYGSTPAYRPVLELHGWGDLQTELNVLSKQGKWEEMAGLIDDEILEAFAVVAELDDLAAAVRRRSEGALDRISFYGLPSFDQDTRSRFVAELQAPASSPD
jgi:probable F420-dependent oxidoreductase